MAEVQKNSMGQSEMQSRFVEFVLMQTQNILFLLGRIPSPDGRQPQINLEFARILVDQLEMIESKTQGNLSSEESEVLKKALANVRLVFVETAQGVSTSSASETMASPSEPEIAKPQPTQQKESEEDDEDNKKRFTKKYN